MTVPDPVRPAASPVFPGTAEPSGEHDPERAEEYAESVGVDPSPDQVEHYQELTGDGPDDGDPSAPPR
ncbi:hypothetical protein [Motilibacter peucedani]|nr:hypothetical protein [Motilibacter peucedani]